MSKARSKPFTHPKSIPLLGNQPIRPMHPIQHPNRSIIQIKLLMMQIMHPGLPRKEIIPTMHCRGIEQFIRQKHPKGQHMGPQNLRREGDGQRVREDMFNGVGVLRGQRDRRGKAVVEFVDSGIENGVVEEAVAVVEHRFAE